MLWWTVQDAIERRLCRDSQASRQVGVGFGADHAEVGLQNFESRRGTRVEPSLCHVVEPPCQIDQAVGETNPLVGRNERVERLAKLTPERAELALDIHVHERELLVRQIDAPRTLPAELDGEIEAEYLMRRVAGNLEAQVGIEA